MKNKPMNSPEKINATKKYKMMLDPRVRINDVQVDNIARIIADFPDASQPDFVGEYLPPVDHPLTLDYFFAVTLQQFGFWEKSSGQYHKPLVAALDGKRMKGSSYLFYAYTRMLDVNPAFFSPAAQANLQLEGLKDIFRDDNGIVQMPVINLHLQQANQYGRDLLDLNLSPEIIIQNAHESESPLHTFLSTLDLLGGYKEDPLHKKQTY